MANFRKVALRHDHARAALRHGLDDDVAIGVAGVHAEDALAAHAVQALQDHVLLRVDERVQALGLARAQRGRDELRELQDSQLLVVVAHRGGVVEDARALALGLGQEPQARQILQVEGRVLAHEHRVVLGERALGEVAPGLVPVLVAVLHPHALRAGAHLLAPVEIALLGPVELVPARLRGAHHRHARVLVGPERFERVEDEEELHCSAGAVRSSSSAAAASASRATTP